MKVATSFPLYLRHIHESLKARILGRPEVCSACGCLRTDHVDAAGRWIGCPTVNVVNP